MTEQQPKKRFKKQIQNPLLRGVAVVEDKMKKINFIIAIALLITLIVNISALENNVNTCSGVMYGFNGSYGSGAMILSWTISVLLIVLIISGIYWFIKSAK